MATETDGTVDAPGTSSLSEMLSVAIAWLDGEGTGENAVARSDCAGTTHQTPAGRAISLLSVAQTQMSRIGVLSKNQVLDDIPTPSLEFLGVEYHLARAYLMFQTHNISPSSQSNESATRNGSTSVEESPSLTRQKNITRSIDYFHAFLKRLEQLGEDMLQEATLKEYHTVLDLEDVADSNGKLSRMNPSQIRELKIQRFQRKKATAQKRSQLQSQLQRRLRMGIAEEEQMDGHDLESLSRTLHIESLRLYAEESLEEIQSSKSELEMIEMAIKMESSRMQHIRADPRMVRNGRSGAAPQGGFPIHPDAKSNNQPLQMTQITQNPVTGQLEYTRQHVANGQLRPLPQAVKRQEIASGVFRPGWNQPTMTLAELAERERAEAIQRSEAQKIAEAEAKLKPKRYDQLVKDGMEDDEKLVEASAKLDRYWDDWKDENPRGSGNKMKDRGDRNF
ncbi:hypothetical protein ACHAWF_001447 [Thalassiosira exigua]